MEQEKFIIQGSEKTSLKQEKVFTLTQEIILGPLVICCLSAILELIINGLTPLLYFMSGFILSLVCFELAILKQKPSYTFLSAEWVDEK